MLGMDVKTRVKCFAKQTRHRVLLAIGVESVPVAFSLSLIAVKTGDREVPEM
jgi:hypothetical protein